ncbi:MAG: phosphatase PAP2 family protein [Candidatus Paceibacterota bacterium]|jgi:membrane-associated phospholipid phosphatase
MNNQIFFFFYNLAHQSVFIDDLIIFLADFFPYIVVFLAVVFLLRRIDWDIKLQAPEFFYKFKEFFLIFFSSGLAWLLSYVLKLLFHTARPFDTFSNVNSLFVETGYAFPSGHSTFFMALAVAIFLKNKRIGCIFILFAILIGLSRIIAGVHFPIDILGGFVLGGAIAFFLKNV